MDNTFSRNIHFEITRFCMGWEGLSTKPTFSSHPTSWVILDKNCTGNCKGHWKHPEMKWEPNIWKETGRHKRRWSSLYQGKSDKLACLSPNITLNSNEWMNPKPSHCVKPEAWKYAEENPPFLNIVLTDNVNLKSINSTSLQLRSTEWAALCKENLSFSSLPAEEVIFQSRCPSSNLSKLILFFFFFTSRWL